MPSPSTPSGEGEPQTTSSDRQGQQEAAENLKKAGKKVADAGLQIPGSSEPAGSASSQAGGESDPMMPPDESSSNSESDIFEEPTESASAGSPSNQDGDMNDPGNMREPDDMMMEEESASGSQQESAEMAESGNSGSTGNLNEEIRAAQEALEQAGISLQTAGGILETATTDDELAEAEATLARARVAIIIAGQDLLEVREIFESTEEDWIIDEAEGALNDANVAIVIATDSIFNSRIELPEFDRRRRQGGGGTNSGESELDKELNDSIVIFENQILEARTEVLGSTPAPTSGENIPGVAVLGGNVGNGDDEGTFAENETGETMLEDPQVIEQGRMPEGADLASADNEAQPLIPEDVPDPQGDDIVAQQLREAAIAETNPELRNKLWEEYKRYKAGL
ncbi:MAG: hypothetical protein HOC70_02635 [Gammaproteobacteria bacterium]|jgi:hypothetical protein|nr:hypothetical protein [Gammaproteobacteria bacterium]MBT7371097.1 hypothetical protein [Gammaproteobacteria bacterium]